MNPICIISFILLSILFLAFVISLLIKYWAKIVHFFKKKQVWRFLINVVMPFAIPLALSFITIDWGNLCKCTDSECNAKIPTADFYVLVIIGVVAIVNLIMQTIIWIKEKNEVDLRWENQAAKHAYNGLFNIQQDKNTQLRTSHHHGLERGMLTQADVPYNIFDQIRKISWELGRTVGKITNVDIKNLDAAFVYRYVYKGANEKDKTWRWVTGKGSKFQPGLNDFAEMSDSTFHYMSHNNVEALFYNDKREAALSQRYIFSYRDHSHNCKGSIVALKVAFSGNDQKLCEGIVMVNTYGEQFLDNLKEHTEKELQMLILDSILPCYRKLLTSELAMLYFCHQDELDDEAKKENQPKPSDPGYPCFFGKDWRKYMQRSKCVVSATKKLWRRK